MPDDPRTAGWWRGSSRVGDPSGKTLLAAHIDSPRQRLGPFAELYDAQPGLMLVLRSAGLRQDFHIRSVRLIRRESLTARRDLYSPSGTRHLVLVTCVPPYDPTHGATGTSSSSWQIPAVRRPPGHPMSGPKKKPPTTTQKSPDSRTQQRFWTP